jgi:hypothetical protein
MFMKQVFKSVLPFAACAMALVFSCAKGPVAVGEGSGTGVGNGVVLGTVIYSDSTPVINAMVRLRTQNYLADTSGRVSTKRDSVFATVVTDARGNFHIDSVDTQMAYSIEVNDERTSAQATLYLNSFLKNDTLKLETRVVKPVKKISGGITINKLPVNAYVRIYGLEKVGKTDSTGQFIITDLPEGKCEDGECSYRLLITSMRTDGSVVSVEKKLEIESEGDTMDIELEGTGPDTDD